MVVTRDDISHAIACFWLEGLYYHEPALNGTGRLIAAPTN